MASVSPLSAELHLGRCHQDGHRTQTPKGGCPASRLRIRRSIWRFSMFLTLLSPFHWPAMLRVFSQRYYLPNRFGEELLLNSRVSVERESVAMSRPSGRTHAEVHIDALQLAMLKMASTEICSAHCPRLRRSEYLPWNLGNRSGSLACFRDRHTCLTTAYAVALLPSACASRFRVIR